MCTVKTQKLLGDQNISTSLLTVCLVPWNDPIIYVFIIYILMANCLFRFVNVGLTCMNLESPFEIERAHGNDTSVSGVEDSWPVW